MRTKVSVPKIQVSNRFTVEDGARAWLAVTAVGAVAALGPKPGRHVAAPSGTVSV